MSVAEAGKDGASSDVHEAIYYDGLSSRRRSVSVRLNGTCEIIENGSIVAAWSYADIRRVDVPFGQLRVMCLTAPALARLEIRDADAAVQLAALCSSLDKGAVSGRSVFQIVGWSVAALASIVLVVLYGVPFAVDRLTPLVPHAVESRLGEIVDKQVRVIFSGKTCENPVGQAAFDKLMNQLRRAGNIEGHASASVVSNDIANAIALPGGKIYLFDGLLAKAENVDEVAGVLAHELGHVRNRDGLRNLIYNGGTSFLFGLLFGDVTGSGAIIFASRELLQASHSRGAERTADDTAIAVMRGLGRSPKPMGEFLLRVTGKEKSKALSIVSSHPLSEERLERMSKGDFPPTAPSLLTDSEWRALRDICRTDGKI
jgi:Zn-dependent protease with chaperone function